MARSAARAGISTIAGRTAIRVGDLVPGILEGEEAMTWQLGLSFFTLFVSGVAIGINLGRMR